MLNQVCSPIHPSVLDSGDTIVKTYRGLSRPDTLLIGFCGTVLMQRLGTALVFQNTFLICSLKLETL